MEIKVDTVVYFYMMICITLLLFNVAYIFNDKGKGIRQARKVKFFEAEIQQQLGIVEHKEEVDQLHKKLMQKKLKRVNNLSAFHQAILKKLDTSEEENTRKYLQELYIVFQSLALVYEKKDNISKAYFSFLISIYRPVADKNYNLLIDTLLSYLQDSTVYCRENVLRALYALGNEDAVVKAYQFLSDQGQYHHVKLLTDGLLTFRGDKEQLSQRLWRRFTDFDLNIRLAVIQFMTFEGTGYEEELFELLRSDEAELEIRLAVLRYFRKHIYTPAKVIMQNLVRNCNDIEWEEATVAAMALSSYPEENTIAVLKAGLKASNWYIRHNCAATLAAIHADRDELEDILQGKDRYAREMLEYMLQ